MKFHIGWLFSQEVSYACIRDWLIRLCGGHFSLHIKVSYACIRGVLSRIREGHFSLHIKVIEAIEM